MTNATAMTLVRGECANFQGGSCLGAAIDGSFAMPLPRCLVGMTLPCSYFERCLMPLAGKMPVYKGADRDYRTKVVTDPDVFDRKIKTAGPEYEHHPFCRHDRKAMRDPDKKPRLCGCGELLAKGKRICEKCRKDARRARMRDLMRNRRNEAQGVS